MNKNHVKTCKDIFQIIEPLISTGYVSGLSHSRIFPDGSRAELWSNSKALEHTYLKTNYTTQKHAPLLYKNKEEVSFFLIDKVHDFDEKSSKNYQMHLSEQREIFNLDNPFIIRGNDDLCEEFFCLYSPKDICGSRDFFINNSYYINGFIKEYKKKVQKITKVAEENRIVRPWIKSYMNSRKLSVREKEVAQWITYGITSREISKRLGIGIRTVEGYIENIKNKYGCDRKKDLQVILRRDGSLFS